MGLLSSIASIAAPIAGSFFGGPVGGAIGSAIGGAIAGGSKGGSQQSGTQTQTVQQQMDPRLQAFIFGDGAGNKGLLSQYQALGQMPQSAGNAVFGNSAQQFLGSNGGSILDQLYGRSNSLLGSNISAPSATGTQAQGAQSAATQAVMPPRSDGASAAPVNGAGVIWNKGATINAPSQNNIDLSGAYQNFISGQSGNNPYLTSALQAGVDATNAGFNKNVATTTDALNNALGGIRSNSVLAGQYGGSRQGIAEGNALKSYTQQLNDANSLLAAQNSANTTAQQAAAYNQGQDRALAATQGLGAQQYGVASQNASMAQQANLANQSLANQTDQFNVGQLNSIGLANAQLAQQNNQYNSNLANQAHQFNSNLLQNNNQFNANLGQANNQFNATLGQNNNQFNAQQQGSTNALNSSNQQAGLAGLSGLLGSAYGYANNQDNYALNRASQVNSLLAPYLGANASQTSSSPLYTNQTANILGGATAGLGLYNGIKGLLGNNSSSGSTNWGSLSDLFGSNGSLSFWS